LLMRLRFFREIRRLNTLAGLSGRASPSYSRRQEGDEFIANLILKRMTASRCRGILYNSKFLLQPGRGQ
jgi:hypothetical protein